MSGVTVSLEGRRALVTGGANGLGAAIIAQLNAAGASGATGSGQPGSVQINSSAQAAAAGLLRARGLRKLRLLERT